MSDLERSIVAWGQSLDAIIALGDSLTDDEWTAPTECPGWTVKDVYSHLVGGEEWMAQGHPKPATGLARIADEPVAARRDTAGPAVLAQLRAIAARRREQLHDNPPDPDQPTFTAYLAPVTVGVLLRMRAFDAWVHEQDVRRAIGVPGNLDAPGAEIAGEIFLGALARVVAKVAAAPAGSMVRFTVDGAVGLDRAVVVDANLRGQVTGPDGEPTVHLRLGWETFSRLAAGRIPADSAPVQITGDPELAGRILDHFAVTP